METKEYIKEIRVTRQDIYDMSRAQNENEFS